MTAPKPSPLDAAKARLVAALASVVEALAGVLRNRVVQYALAAGIASALGLGGALSTEAGRLAVGMAPEPAPVVAEAAPVDPGPSAAEAVPVEPAEVVAPADVAPGAAL